MYFRTKIIFCKPYIDFNVYFFINTKCDICLFIYTHVQLNNTLSSCLCLAFTIRFTCLWPSVLDSYTRILLWIPQWYVSREKLFRGQLFWEILS